MTDPSILFHEEQYFRPVWWAMPAIIGSGFLAFFLVVVMFNTATGGKEWNSPAIVPVLAVVAFMGFGLFRTVWFMWKAKLITEVRRDGFYVAVPPYQPKFTVVYPGEIAEYQMRKWGDVMLDYITPFGKPQPNTKSYQVSGGGQGIQFLLYDGKRIFVATEHPEELAVALNQMIVRAASGR